ncbi:pectinesterase/pectinesterase inhibitor PPE8B-like [Impatiens glandulifera]|uniref:pectinesterase/pectinesterase inhibitor PPE8B-like n=1 Tax=Impatiens glandulifera TaxID=253017 RepID=UPI001FB0E5CB|nr:pectinesterase/pectinesterase inhibitor PPE8B-like [Impatiens glandulifera]
MAINSVPLAASSLLLLLLILCSCSGSFGNQDPVNSDLKVPVPEFINTVKGMLKVVQSVTSTVLKFSRGFGNSRLSNAISDCLDMLDLSSEELSWTLSACQNGSQGEGGTGNQGLDMKTWLSGALVNLDTCIDGFEGTNSFVQKVVAGGLSKISTLVLNSLHQIQDKIPNNIGASVVVIGNRQFPPWLNGTDKGHLETNRLPIDVVVAIDGSGKFTKIVDAIAAAPELSTKRYVIQVKKGVYNEYVEISKKKWNIMMIGEGMDNTIITGNHSYKGGWTTYRSATFGVKGKGFIARDITFENTAGPEMHQAVAFRSDSDLSVLHRCGFRGYQDTLYAHSMRQFYSECRISGTVDFIFGDGTVVFQNCQILARKGLPGQKNVVTAQGRKDPVEPSGFSIQFCNITAEPDVLASLNTTTTYLGRPWKLYSRTIFMQSYIGIAIKAEGWLEWDGNFALDTLWYGEYMNHGPSSGLQGRIKWPGFHPVIDSSQATNFTVGKFISGDTWLPSTGINYKAGL